MLKHTSHKLTGVIGLDHFNIKVLSYQYEDYTV